MITERFDSGFRLFDGSQLNRLRDQANQSFSDPQPGGLVLYVDPIHGSNSGSTGQTWNGAYATMAKALDRLATENAKRSKSADNSRIYFVGQLREQLIAPLGVSGVMIAGAAQGNVRDDNGAKWYAPAAATAGQALLELREQGWVLANFLMAPETTTGAAVKANRGESATYPDSSHFQLLGMRFVGTGGTTYGLQDVGGNHHYVVDGCEFQSLTRGIICTSTAIAVPLRNRIINSRFYANTNDINSSQSYGEIAGNKFFTAGSGAHDVIDLAENAGQGGNNIVTGNIFPNAIADIDPGNGYDGHATDVWTGNLVTDQAAFAFGNPA